VGGKATGAGRSATSPTCASSQHSCSICTSRFRTCRVPPAARHLLVLQLLKYLDGLAAESGADVTLRGELATAYEKVANVQGGYRQANLRERCGAIGVTARRWPFRQALPPQPEVRRELCGTTVSWAKCWPVSGDSAGASLPPARALSIAEELADPPGSTLQVGATSAA